MEFVKLAIPEVIEVRPTVYGDARGFFLESWERRKFAAGGIDRDFVQDNHSRSARGVLRGLHYQLVRPQGKLVRCVVGEVFDVAVDIRRSSPTFGRWVAAVLSAQNMRELFVPEGFAHGFLVTSEHAEVIYKCTEYYHPEHERSIRWDDPELGIEWPTRTTGAPILSAKDAMGKRLADAEVFA